MNFRLCLPLAQINKLSPHREPHIITPMKAQARHLTQPLPNANAPMTRYAAIAGTLALVCTSLPIKAQQFVAHEQYATGQSPVAITSADFDNDTFIDIAVLNEADNSVTILHNNGSGAFTTGPTLATGNGPQDIVSGDYNGDSLPDLAITNKSDNSLSILLNDGAGGFTPSAGSPFTTGVTGLSPTALHNLDTNGDNRLDIVIANRTAAEAATPKVSILLGNGDGSFQPPVEKVVGLFPNDIISADFNNDGFSDLVSVNSHLGTANDSAAEQSANLSFLAGSASGAFADKLDTQLDFRPSALGHGDFNEDGIEDLAIIQVNNGENRSRVHILLGEDIAENSGAGDGRGDGTFAATGATLYSIGITPSAILVSDLDSDGHLDLITTHLDSNSLLTLFGHGDGTFAISEHFYSAGAAPTAMTRADFNNDGVADIAITASATNKVGVLFGRSDGSFQTAMTRAIRTDATPLRHGDFNNDGLLDTATIDPANQQLVVRLRKHRNTFQASATTPLTTTPQALTVGQFNDDERDDIAIIYRNSTQAEIFLADENGQLSPAFNYELITNPVANPTDIIQADFNADGHLDLAVTSSSSDNMLVIPGQGDGSFGDAILLGTGLQPSHLVTHDINKNERPDLISLNEANNTLALLINNGDFNFDNPRNYPIEGDARGLLREDYDGDGIDDFLVSYKESHQLKLFRGNISGKLERAIDFSIGQFTHRLTSGDFNRDQIPDIAATIDNSSSLLILYGNGDGTLRPGINLSLGTAAKLNHLITLDSNGDGIDEIAITDSERGKIYIVDSLDGTAYALRNTYNSTRLGSSGAVGQIIALDSDQDGKLDLASANTGSTNIGVLQGAGDGTYSDIATYNTDATPPVALVSDDFDGDGYPDIATANEAEVSIFLNNGSGSYNEAISLAIPGSNPEAITTGDYNDDGNPDLIVTLPETNQLALFPGDANTPSRFAAATPLSGAYLDQPTAIATTDIDQDGDADLIITNSGSAETAILLNPGDGSFNFTPLNLNFSAAASPLGHTLADLNMDGGTDIITSGRDITVLLNAGNYMPTPFNIAAVTDAPISTPAVAPVTATINGLEVTLSAGIEAIDIPIDSDPITISGLGSPASISIEQGSYAINGAPFTEQTGSVTNGDTVVVRHNSAYSANTTTYATLSVGGYSDRFYVTTIDDGSKPDAFPFTEVTEAELDSLVESEPVTITGLTVPARISVAGGWYAINGGAFTNDVGEIEDGDSVVARVRTLPVPDGYEVTSSAVVTIGGITSAFNVTTKADQSPDPFNFPDKPNTKPSTRALSPWVVISGITAPTPISVEGGKYALLDDAQNFTDEDGLIPPFARNGNPQKVRISVIAPATFNTTAEISVTIGDYTDTFTITTTDGGVTETAEETEGGVDEQNLFGCSMRSTEGSGIDPTLPLLLLGSALALWRRQRG